MENDLLKAVQSGEINEFEMLRAHKEITDQMSAVQMMLAAGASQVIANTPVQDAPDPARPEHPIPIPADADTRLDSLQERMMRGELDPTDMMTEAAAQNLLQISLERRDELDSAIAAAVAKKGDVSLGVAGAVSDVNQLGPGFMEMGFGATTAGLIGKAAGALGKGALGPIGVAGALGEIALGEAMSEQLDGEGILESILMDPSRRGQLPGSTFGQALVDVAPGALQEAGDVVGRGPIPDSLMMLLETIGQDLSSGQLPGSTIDRNFRLTESLEDFLRSLSPDPSSLSPISSAKTDGPKIVLPGEVQTKAKGNVRFQKR